ncbi:ribosome-inactivating family protein [Kitasatospora sp. NPDC059827]|uniref:ribosome-inactivating family protein n=1 Tax=Kitasatospora sp. NPDC059827 TaxID=3346964 RepID=UPI0036687C88
MHLHPTSSVRRTGRRLAVLLLALVSAFSLLYGAAAPKANAETNQRWTDINWAMNGYTGPRNSPASRDQFYAYNDMVNALRNAAAHQMDNVDSSSAYMDTPTRTDTHRVIRVLVWTDEDDGSRAHLALYFNVDNLYLMGYSAHGVHYRFNTDETAHLATEIQRHEGLAAAPSVQLISADGSYGQLSAPDTWRANQQYTALMLEQRARTLINSTSGQRNSPGVRQALAYLIGATSEAARFGWIQNRIAQTIHHGGDPAEPGEPANIGPFGTDLETNWDALSRMAHRTAAHRTDPGVRIDGRVYYGVYDIGIPTNSRPRLTPFLALYASGR